jgi:hypothetical protein
MRTALMPTVATEIERDLRAMVAAEQDQGAVSEGQSSPEDATGWYPFAPRDGGPPIVPPTPWADVDLLGVTTAGSLLVITFRWRPSGQTFAHTSDLSEFDDEPRLTAGIIEYQLQRLLLSSRWPNPPGSLTVGSVTVVTGLV